ncbi:MAG TPA: hypothetical protein VME18_01045 [Acidobacteriaceae bacterium]|nr:hypothetical protein [Acidobacteriaceae bacterium]
MEVDHIWRIDGLDSNANPAGQSAARRRRRFVEEIAPPDASDSGEEEPSAPDQPAK